MYILFDSESIEGKAILYYIYNSESNIKFIESVRYVPNTWINLHKNIKNDENNIKSIIADLGSHFYNHLSVNYLFKIDVSLFNLSEHITRQELLGSDYIRSICITYDNVDNLLKFKKDALELWNLFTKKISLNSKTTIKKYLYEISSYSAYWNCIGEVNKINKDTLFLKENEKENLFNNIDNFINSKEDYQKFNINYKMNILLYGIPGSGKTKTALTIASHINTNIGILPFTHNLTDTLLISGINDLQTMDVKVVVFEDIDCIFTDRKKNDTSKNNITLSGLLNILDGISRNEDIIIIMTANEIEAFDNALLRSIRMDIIIEYDYANKYQLYNFFKYYRPQITDEEFNKLYKFIEYKKVTLADLQKYLFNNRNNKSILDNIDDLKIILKSKKELKNIMLYN